MSSSTGMEADPARAGPIPLASVGLDMAMADVYWGTHIPGCAG